MVIDYSTDVGKLRLRTGDYKDIFWLPDSVYTSVLAESSGNLNQAAKVCSMFILGMMASNVRSRLVQVECYSNQEFEQYQKYLMMLHSNPNFSGVCPVPYTGSRPVGTTEKSKINTFVENIDKAYVHYNADEHLQQIADINDMASSSASGWTLI